MTTMHNLMEGRSWAPSEVGVSAREAEVLAALAEHLTNAEIGARLFISIRTVESHVSSLLRKLQVDDRRALAAVAATVLPAGRIAPGQTVPGQTVPGQTRAGPGGADRAGPGRTGRAGPGSVHRGRRSAALAADVVRRAGSRTGRPGRCAGRAPPDHRPRAGRGRQDPPRAECGRRGSRPVRRWRLVRRPGARHRPVDDRARDRGRARPLRASALPGGGHRAALAGRPGDAAGAGQLRASAGWGGGPLERLLSGSPRLSVLVTSRARLLVPFEWVFPVHGLAVAADDGGPGDAVQLFLERAAAGGSRCHAGGHGAGRGRSAADSTAWRWRSS